MGRLIEELDYRATAMGPLILRRRWVAAIDADVIEVILGEEHLMSSLFTVGETELAVRGLAHVACLSPEVAAAVPAALGPGSGLVHGTARIFAPGFHDRSPHERHPLLRDKRAAGAEPGEDPGSFRRILVRHVCAMGVNAAG